MSLSQRLKQIDTMVQQQYDHIWDCCCDHGYLGIELLERSAANIIHFVDVVPKLTLELSNRLSVQQQQYSADQWQVHCIDVATLPIDETPASSSHLIIIAGVGGDLIIELVKGILNNNPGRYLEFIVCPVYHQYKLRNALISWGLSLHAEKLLREKKRFYEVIHVSTQSHVGAKISPVGSVMWDFNCQEHRDYHQRILQHYARIKKSSGDTEQVVAQYLALRQ